MRPPLPLPWSPSLVVAGLLLAGCVTPYEVPEEPGEVAGAIATARGFLERGDTAHALELLRRTREVRGAPTAVRDELELLFIDVAATRLEELAGVGDPDALLELTEVNLPRQLAVRAGLMAARMELADDDPKAAVKIVRKLDAQFPFHHERVEAGAILWEAGTEMAADDPGFLGLFTLRDNGLAALEFLCDHYVRDERWDRAAFRVAELYEEDEEWELARDWHQNLLSFRPASPLVVTSLARIPRLRLAEIESPEYDRTEVEEARAELEYWLSVHGDHPAADEARVDYADALRRLVLSDLVIAEFYERNDKTQGARFHLDRAAETAALIEDEELDERITEVERDVRELEEDELQG